MTSERHGVRDNLEEFINIYRNEVCLWQIKNKDYHNRDKKTAAYNKLIEQYKKIEPNANRDMIVKKLNGLRTNYRKEKKKVEESSRSGAGTNDIYVPTLWYYDLLKFLDDDQGTPRGSRSNIDENDSSQENESESDIPPSQVRDDDFSETASTSEQTLNRPSRPPSRKSQSHSSGSTDLSNEVLQSVKEHFKRPILKDDRFDVFGKNVAMKLRDLQREQRLIAEKIINDTLFQAEMGRLTLPHQPQQFIHVTPTPSPQTHQPQQFIRATSTPSLPTYQSQQFIRLASTPSPSISVSENQQEYDDYSSMSPLQYNSDSQHSTENIVQLSIPEQSAATYVSNFTDFQQIL